MGNGSQDTASRIAKLLIAREAKLAVAESVTAGRVQALIATISGASNFFEGGVVAYSLSQKVRLLGVDPDHAEAVNCVSPEVCLQMAAGAARLFQTEFALATTGYAEPDEAHQIDVPQAHVAVWWAGEVHAAGCNHGKLLSHILLRTTQGRRKAQKELARKALAHLLATLDSME